MVSLAKVLLIRGPIYQEYSNYTKNFGYQSIRVGIIKLYNKKTRKNDTSCEHKLIFDSCSALQNFSLALMGKRQEEGEGRMT